MIEQVILILIWIGIITTVLTYALYPLILYVWAKLKKNKIQINPNYEPDLTILVAAYNEEDNIPELVESIFKSNYPPDKIKVVIGSDGSTDRTVEIVKELQKEYPNIIVIELEHSGKNATINKLIEFADTDVVVFMDADLRLTPQTLHNLVKYLSDDSIALVQSNIYYQNGEITGNAGTQGENSYQQYENFLRRCESKISSTVNNFGVYAIRRNYFSRIPNDKVCDDMYQIYQTIIKGKRVIVSDEALTIDVREKNTKNEFNRRIRLAAGGMATIASSPKIMSPAIGSPAFFIWFHKILRWFSPIFLIIFAVSIFLITPYTLLWYFLLFSMLILFAFGLIGFISEKFGYNFRFGHIPLFILLMNWGFLCAIFRFISGGQNSSWSREGLQSTNG